MQVSTEALLLSNRISRPHSYRNFVKAASGWLGSPKQPPSFSSSLKRRPRPLPPGSQSTDKVSKGDTEAQPRPVPVPTCSANTGPSVARAQRPAPEGKSAGAASRSAANTHWLSERTSLKTRSPALLKMALRSMRKTRGCWGSIRALHRTPEAAPAPQVTKAGPSPARFPSSYVPLASPPSFPPVAFLSPLPPPPFPLESTRAPLFQSRLP